jgi:hypothetical protein
MQSFICCLGDFAVVLFMPLLEAGAVEDDGVVVLGYVERSDGAVDDGLVCATATPAAMSAATAKDAATRFIGSSDQFAEIAKHDRAWRRKECQEDPVAA